MADQLITFGTGNLKVNEDNELYTTGGGGGTSDATAANQVLTNTAIGATNETAAANESATVGLNGLLKAVLAKMRFSNNSAAPAANTLMGALTGVANAAVQTWTEGRAVLLSVDLSGFLRVLARTEVYTAPVTGELAGATSATQLPNVACKMVQFKASYDNAGRVYIGVSGVTKADGTTDTTTGYQLNAGEGTTWITVDNLNRFYRICDNAGDDLTYLAVN